MNNNTVGFLPIIITLPMFALMILLIVSSWELFIKAGRKGWEAVIPIYNTYVLLQIVGRPGWWLLLMFLPLVGFVIGIIFLIDLAKSFGKSTTFAVFGLILFPYIGFPILGLGKDKYLGPSVNNTGIPTPPAAGSAVPASTQAPAVLPQTPPTAS